MGKPNKPKKGKDFQKIKLKVGRKIKREGNVTDTSFKSKKIVIKEQLKRGVEAALSSSGLPKLGIKDLLSRLEHYSSVTRLETLHKLKDVLVSNPAHITTHLSLILERLCELMVDKDNSVRKSVTYVLNIVLSRASGSQIEPFFHLVSSYICCAMTHIVAEIRRDSLRYLDIMLEKFPDLTVATETNILPNFLNQISSLKEGQGSNNARTLSVTPGEQITSQKWRIDVLKRMELFLNSAFNHWNSESDLKREKIDKEIYMDGKQPLYVAVYSNRDCAPQHTIYSLDDILGVNNEEKQMTSNTLKDEESLRKYGEVLVPLLVETWVECVTTTGKGHANLSCEEAETMHCILNVCSVFGNWTQKLSNQNESTTASSNWLQAKFGGDFLVHFMGGFPYSISSRNTANLVNKLSSQDINLSICEVHTLLQLSQFQSQVVKFVQFSMSNGSIHGTANVAKVIRIMTNLVNDNEEHVQALLESMWELAIKWKPERKDRQLITNYFADFVLDYYKHKNIIESSSALSEWLYSLPKELIKLSDNPELFLPVVQYSSKFAARKHKHFMEGLQENHIEIIGLLGKFKSNADLDIACKLQRICVSLISRIPTLAPASFCELSSALKLNTVAVRNVDYLLQLLSLRCFRDNAINLMAGFEPRHFLSLLLSLQFGISHRETESLETHYCTNPDFAHFRTHLLAETPRFAVYPDDGPTWKRYMHITKEVSRIFLLFPEMQRVEEASFTYLEQLLEKHSYIPAHSAVGILNFVSMLHLASNNENNGLNDDLSVVVVELALASMASGILLKSLPEALDQKYACDKLLDSVTSFVHVTGLSSLLLQVFDHQLQELDEMSEANAKCILSVINYHLTESLFKNNLELMVKILHKVKSFTGGKNAGHSLWADVSHNLKVAQRLQNQFDEEDDN